MTPRTPLPLRRWSSNLLCGLSLLIFLLAIATLVPSYSVMDVWVLQRRLPATTYPTYERVVLKSSRGQLFLGHDRMQFAPTLNDSSAFYHDVVNAPPPSLAIARNPAARSITFPGFQFMIWDPPHADWHVLLPLWLFLLFAIPPVLWLRRWRRKGGRGRRFAVTVAEPTEAKGA